MTDALELLPRAMLIGAGATLVMDLWAMLLKQFGVPSLNMAFLGRWTGHLFHGRVRHSNIAAASPIRGERVIGWCAHYSIGITFAGVLLWAYRLSWAQSPSLAPAMLVGIGTVVAPLFVLQPAMGAGIASSKTPRPVFNAVKSVVTHTVFGFGLYLAGLVTSAIFAGAE